MNAGEHMSPFRRIVVSGVVDAAAVDTVTDAVRGVLEHDPGVELDIRGVEHWVDDALRDLAACAQLGPVEILAAGRRRRPRISAGTGTP